MISFGSNVGELILRNTLWENTRGLNSAVERMTSGYKLNHAGDNAAGHFMVTDLSTQISSMLQVQQNTEDGLAMLQIAGGGLENIKDLFERLRDLSTQASNDSYDDAARESMQAEADAIIEEINRIQQITQYNGESLFGTPKNPDSGVNRIAKSAKVHNSTEGSIETQSINNIPTSITSHKLSSAPATAKAQNTKATAAAASTEKEEGAVDFAANETKTIEIDGVEYEITNQNATANSISYIKDLQTGQITMFANNLTIRAQEDTAHDIILQGRNNTIYGGDLADRIEIKGLTSIDNYIYGGAGDDTLINPISWENYLYGEDGNDTLEISAAGGAAYGGNGDDIFNMSGSTQRVKVYGGTGNDTFNLSGSSTDYNMLYGQEGEDIFNIGSGSNDNLVDGGSGTNSITDNGPNTIKVNVPGANYNVIDLAGNETKEITINGIKYTVRNRNSTDRILAYSVEDDGSIKFKGDYTDITGEANKAHKVILDMYGSTFRGGNLADNITITGNVDQNNANTIYGGAGNDIIKSNTYSNTIFGGDGDDTIEAINKYNRVYGESGNDNITIKSISSTTIFNGLADGGAGDDTITIDSNVNNYVVNGGSGSNTLIDNGTNTLEAGFNPDTDTGVEVVFNGNETKVITINGIDYTIKNNSSYTSTLVYSYNPVTGEISFGGYNWIVHGDENKSHNIIFYAGNSSFYGGNLDDKIVNYGVNATIYGQEGNDELINQGVYATMYGDNGNDTITANVAAHLYAGAGDDIININTAISNRVVNGGTGNDTYNLNKYANVVDEGGDNIYNIYADNASVSGSTGNDTFYVIGDNNTVLGGSGNDYFVIDGGHNTIDGGTDNNSFVNNSPDTDISNVTSDPNSGKLSFTSKGEVKTFTLNGKTYTITNNSSSSNVIEYSFNPNTKLITINGSNFQIDADKNEAAILNIRGDNNIINGSNLADTITIESGSNNTINGKNGDDSLIMNSANNSINGESGNDKITLNASSNLAVTGGDGNDSFNINSDNNTNISLGAGNNQITVNGKLNNITSGDGNNTFTINDDSNTIKAGEGDNRFVINSSNNTVTAGRGQNNIGIQGDSNNLNIQNAEGDINILGDSNTINIVRGDNNITIRGDKNNYTSTTGNKDISVIGNENDILTGNGNDKIDFRGDYNTLETISGTKDITIRGNNNNVQGGDGSDAISINGDNNTAKGGNSNDSFVVGDGNNNIIDGEGGSRNTIINNGIDTVFTNAVDITPDPFEVKIKVGIGSGDDKYITSSISFNLFDFAVDFSSAESAAESLELIDDMLNTVDKQLLNIGTTINRLECVLDAQSLKIENLINTRSTIRDADIAEESSKYIRYQILQQATATLLSASRNVRTDNILGLLQNIG